MDVNTAIHYGMLVAETLIINEVLAVVVPPLFMLYAGIRSIIMARRWLGLTNKYW